MRTPPSGKAADTGTEPARAGVAGNVFRVARERPEYAFSLMLEYLPLSLAVREFMRLYALATDVADPGTPILDVGCGDGLFWSVFPYASGWQVDGVELSRDTAEDARRRGVFRTLWQGDVTRLKTPVATYDVVLGNCSLEHVPDIHVALQRMVAALRPGGTLLLFVPSFQWTQTLRAFRALGAVSNRLRMAAQGALDGFFQHHHLYSAQTWMRLVVEAGARDPEAAGLGWEPLNRLFETHLYLSLPEFVGKTLAGHYPRLAPRRRTLPDDVVDALVGPLEDPGSPHHVEYLVAARAPG